MDDRVDISPLPKHVNELATLVIGCGIAVHRELGPGLLESVYERALQIELGAAGIQVASQVQVPVVYRGTIIGDHRIDILIANTIVVELKSVAAISAIHEAQTLTYLKLGAFPLGLLMNFNVPVLRSGIRRIINPNWRVLPDTKPIPVILQQADLHDTRRFVKRPSS